MTNPQTPATQAGRLFLSILDHQARHVGLAPELTEDFPRRILAIEAEARADCKDAGHRVAYDKGWDAALRGAAERVRALLVVRMEAGGDECINRAAVLAILDPETTTP